MLSCCIGALVAAPVYGQNTVTVNAVGPGLAKAGERVVFEFMISADPEFLLRGYIITPPCALDPQDGATGTVDGPLVDMDTARSDSVMCGAPCNCICAGWPIIEQRDCDPFEPFVGYSLIFASDSPLVGVGPAYMAEVKYTVSADATGSFDFEFVDPETPDNEPADTSLRDKSSDPVFADWIGTTVVIVDCLVAGDCDDGEGCTLDTCDSENVCVNEFQVEVYADICEPFDPPSAPQPNLEDILCLLDDFGDGSAVDGCECNGFRNTTDLHPCPEDGGGDGSIGMDDILIMLDAFAGLSPCDDPCPG